MKNKVQLICYVDRLTNGGFKDLNHLISGPLDGIFGAIHTLPFYSPIDGADAGFDPIDHTSVDYRLGDWSDVSKLGKKIDLVADLIVNHVSAESPEFLDYLEKGEDSEYAGLFLTKETVFPNGMNIEDLKRIYRPRPNAPFTLITLADGTSKEFWTTFTANQIDINVNHQKGKEYLSKILQQFGEAGVKLIRLDAVGYAIKKAGTSCFMIPQTYAFIENLTKEAHALGMKILVEIHSYYQDQIDIAKQVDYVYDFALPPLVLHALYRQDGSHLKHWMDIRPHNAITVLDTHDGIGIIDVGMKSNKPSHQGLLPPTEIDYLVNEMHSRTQGTSLKATGIAASNLDLYQVNSTYYDTLGQDDNLYLLARAIQFFAPGIPQIYYTGFLAEPNDMDLLARTQVGRDINRHYFVDGEIEQALQRPVVQELIQLIKIRNSHPAFEGRFSCTFENQNLEMIWQSQNQIIVLSIQFEKLTWSIRDQEQTIYSSNLTTAG